MVAIRARAVLPERRPSNGRGRGSARLQLYLRQSSALVRCHKLHLRWESLPVLRHFRRWQALPDDQIRGRQRYGYYAPLHRRRLELVRRAEIPHARPPVATPPHSQRPHIPTTPRPPPAPPPPPPGAPHFRTGARGERRGGGGGRASWPAFRAARMVVSKK